MTFGTTAVQQNDKGVLVWVGSGDAANFHSLIPESYSQCLLIEADEMQTEPLLQLQQRDEKVRSLIRAVATEDGPSLFYRYNLDQFNALQPATGLLQLYPGLKLQEQVTLQAISISTLIREQQLEPTFKHTLVLSVPAQAYGLLRSLAEQDLLTLFYQLNVQVGQTELYQDAGTCSELEFWLQQQGYLLCETDKSDPDLWLVVFRRHPLLDKLRDRELELHKLTTQLADALPLKQQLIKCELENNELKLKLVDSQHLNQLLEDCEKNSNSLKNQLSSNVIELAESNTMLQKLRQEIWLQEQRFEEAQKTPESLEQEILRLSRDNAALNSQISLLEENHNAETQAWNEKVLEIEREAESERMSAAVQTLQLKQQLQTQEDQLQVALSEVAKLKEHLQHSQMLMIEANESVEETEQLKLQLHSLEAQLQALTTAHTELVTNYEFQAQQAIQSETVALATQHSLEQKLQHAEQILVAEREAAKVVTAELKAQLQTDEHQLRAAMASNAELVAKVESLQSQTVLTETRVAELQQQLDSCIINLSNATTHATHRLTTINQLETTNRRLLDENQQLNARQHALQQEMLKAEAQIDLIKELILKE